MATLAMGIVGGVLGGMVGMPQLGFVVGSILGQVLFPTKPKVPAIGDLSVTTSTYGVAIPIAYGTIRCAGNMIWALPLNQQEQKHGKGGITSGGTTTYANYASFALAFVAGPAVGISRIWANGLCIYDSSNSVIAAGYWNFTFAFYPGDETQTPDPLIAANVSGYAPAFRGLCYIVVNNWNTQMFNNRIPNIEAEVVMAGNPSNDVQYITPSASTNFTGFGLQQFGFNPGRNAVYVGGNGGSLSAGVRTFGFNTLTENRQTGDATLTAGGDTIYSGSPICVGPSGNMYFSASDSQDSQTLFKVDPNLMTSVGSYGTAGNSPPGPAFPPTQLVAMVNIVEGACVDSSQNGQRNFIACFGLNFVPLTVLDSTHMSFLWNGNGEGLSFPNMIACCANAPPVAQQCTFWILAQDSSGANSSIGLYECVVQADASVSLTDEVSQGVDFQLFDTITSAVWNNDGHGAALGPMMDQTDGGLIFIVGRASTPGSYIFKYLPGFGIQWVTQTNTPAPSNSKVMAAQSNIISSAFGFVSADGVHNSLATLINTATGVLIVDGATVDATGPFIAGGEQFFDGLSQSVTATQGSGAKEAVGKVYLNLIQAGPQTLATIVQDISARVGLGPNSAAYGGSPPIDVSQLTDFVWGYVIAGQMQAVEALKPLMAAYFFAPVESDGLIVFKKNQQANSFALTKSDLPYLDDKGDNVIKQTRIQEVDLPQGLSVTFKDYSLDYQVNAVAEDRFGAPIAGYNNTTNPDFMKFQVPKITVGAFSDTSLDLPIVFESAVPAAQIGQVMLYTMWAERTAVQFRVPTDNLVIDPNDNGTLDLEDGTILTLRVTKTTTNADFSTTIDAVTEQVSTYTSTKPANGSLVYRQQLPPAPGQTQLFLLDMPLLQDEDDMSQRASRLYVAMSGLVNPWGGGTLWDSSDGTNFVQTGTRAIIPAAWGAITGALSTTTHPFQTDVTSSLQVWMNNGAELDSVDDTDFLNDVNVAIIGSPTLDNWEVVSFQNAEQNDDGSYTVTGFIRGKRGTDVQVNTHVNGEYFIIPSSSSFTSLVVPYGDLNTPGYYRGVGFNNLVENVQTQVLTDTGADNKPYAPWLLAAVSTGGGSPDIDFSWVRRTRLGGDWLPFIGTVPLAEETESYQVDIYNGSSVVRTLDSTSPSVTYPNADIITDFGTFPASITFEVYQISATVGRGFGRKRTITF